MARLDGRRGRREPDVVGGVAAAPAPRRGPLRGPDHRLEEHAAHEAGPEGGPRRHRQVDGGLAAHVELDVERQLSVRGRTVSREGLSSL